MDWKRLMILLDLFIEPQMSVNTSIIGGVGLGSGFIQGLMYMKER